MVKKIFLFYGNQTFFVMLTRTHHWIIHYASLIHYAPYSLFIEGPAILPAMPFSRQQKYSYTHKCSLPRPSYSPSLIQPII